LDRRPYRAAVRTCRLRRRSAKLPIALLKLGPELIVLLKQPGQLSTYKIEESVYFLLVVATFADRRLAERDIANVGWGQRHRITSRTRTTLAFTGHPTHFRGADRGPQ
jgi:hypothetical protein